MEYKDYYKVLGVKRQETADEIKRAYRKLARKFHPDVNPGDEKSSDRFKEINEAYQVLGDTEKRRKYDQFGADYRKVGSVEEAFRRGGVQGDGMGGFGFSGFGGFSEFFESLFGAATVQRPGVRGTRSARPSRVADIEHELTVTLDEVFHGGLRILNLKVPEPDGRSRNRRLEVKIPAGVRDGSRIRVANEGSLRTDGTRGDLFLRVKMAETPGFERMGTTLISEIEVPLSEALLGSMRTIGHIDGSSLRLKVPQETKDGAMLRLRGQGLPSLNGEESGDLLVRVKVTLPTKLTQREKTLIYDFGTRRNENPTKPGLPGEGKDVGQHDEESVNVL